MASLKPNLLVVAHPDDETIFFGGLVQSLRKHPWHLICVTDGNGDGRGLQRNGELLAAAKALKIKNVEQWNFPDVYEQRLNEEELNARLAPWAKKAHQVYTHGPIGEYGHPHHQDVSSAVHRAFRGRLPVWGTAYNCLPQKRVLLTKKQHAIKAKIISDFYRIETERFVHLLPLFSEEGFCRFSPGEVEAVSRALRGQPLDQKKLRHYRWMKSILPVSAYNGLKRPF